MTDGRTLGRARRAIINDLPGNLGQGNDVIAWAAAEQGAIHRMDK